ncbi:hypothetical protein [Dongia sp.]|uniref:hypothetical protein n=1 Tax=Dongia sp. TaxID=1977262 RepID=UPI0035AFF132
MKRDTAIVFMDALLRMGPSFDELTNITYQIEDETERKFIRRQIASAMQSLGYEMAMHIVRQYPDLDPDKKG